MTAVLVALGVAGWLLAVGVAVVQRRRINAQPTRYLNSPLQPTRVVVAADVARQLREARAIALASDPPIARASEAPAGDIGRFNGLPVVIDPELPEGTWRME